MERPFGSGLRSECAYSPSFGFRLHRGDHDCSIGTCFSSAFEQRRESVGDTVEIAGDHDDVRTRTLFEHVDGFPNDHLVRSSVPRAVVSACLPKGTVVKLADFLKRQSVNPPQS